MIGVSRIGTLALLFCCLVSASCRSEPRVETAVAAYGPAEYLGASSCISCHHDAMADWSRSEHSKAMLEATLETVLGDFNDTTFTYAGVTSTFRQQGGKHYVTTDGPDGTTGKYGGDSIYTA